MAQKYIVTRESEYLFEPGFNVGDIVCVDGSSDLIEYGGFVWNASKPRAADHCEGCYYHSPDWCKDSLLPYVEFANHAPDMAELIESHAEFESAGRWLYRGFIVVRDDYTDVMSGKTRGWHVPGIDPYARGKATRPFNRMKDAFMWIERTYGDSHVA